MYRRFVAKLWAIDPVGRNIVISIST